MIYNPISRRYFLQGLGTGLMLPFLPSIMPRAYAAGFPVRYVQMLTPLGYHGEHFFPQGMALTQNAAGVHAAQLSSISGNISTLFGSGFNNYKNKMTLLRGLHVLPKAGLEEQHNASYPGASSAVNNGRDPNTNDNYPGVYPYTVDTVLALSNKIYPSATGIQKQVVICPAYLSGGRSNFSWTKINNQVQRVEGTTTTASLLAKFTQLTSGSSGGVPTADPNAARKADIVSSVFADYKSVRTNPKLSTDDRNRLDRYIGLIDEIQKGLGTVPTPSSGPSCTNPTLENDADLDGRTRNQLRILAAGMACQLTRVATVTLVRPTDADGTGHNKHHDASNTDLSNYMKPHLDHTAFFMGLLDSIKEGGGSLLDNTVLMGSAEFGERYEGNQTGHIHTHKDMTVMVAGGGAGAFQMGQYIDYRKSGSRPYNNFLISIYNAMGLSSSDYEKEGIIGIGDYEPTLVSQFMFDKYTSTAEKRKALPGLWLGGNMG
jgi:hypothetical protein